MGIYDRDYYREEHSRTVGFGGWGWSVTKWLMVINIAVFVLDQLLLSAGIGYEIRDRFFGVIDAMPIMEAWGYFSIDKAILHGQIWRFITFQFLHAGVWHLIFNMMALYFFGTMIESYLGSARYLAFYLLCGVSGAVCYVVLSMLHVLGSGPGQPMVGASAGIFGVLIAAARIAPEATVIVWFVPMRLKTLAWGLIGLALFIILTGRANSGGEAAHLGGAALGYILINNVHWLNFFGRFSGLQRRVQRSQGAWRRKLDAERVSEEEIDRILAKIHEHGMESLTAREKQTLMDASRRDR